jgi:rare lipoprotein A
MQARTAFTLTGLLLSGLGFHHAHAASIAPQAQAKVQVRAQAQAKAQPARPVAETLLDQGEATWYGGWHTGRLTSNGERFDPRKMTAAHPSLPLGTMVRVTDMSTGRSVIVRVNDREPPHGVRCIDLSEGAAIALGIHSRGVAEVKLTAVEPRDSVVEVADAPDDAVAVDARPAPARHAISRHGRRHRRHAGR